MSVQLPAAIRRWIEDVAGPIAFVGEHPAAGRSRSIRLVDIEDDGTTVPLILRSDTPDSPFANTALTLRREAQFLLALNDQPVRVPRCLGVNPEGSAMLLERLDGSASTAFAGDAERERVMRAYVRELVALHSLDAASLPLPVPLPPPGRSPALVDLDDYVRAYRSMCPRHELFEQVVAWLEDNAPAVRDEVVVLHGDTGPGNFMHRDGEITGLLDFEMAHVGDREDDLAWLWFRCELLHGDSHVGDYLRWYESESGHAIDLDRVRYYRVLVLTRCVASNLFVEGLPSTVPRAGLTKTEPWLRAVLAQAGGPVLGPVADIGAFPARLEEGV